MTLPFSLKQGPALLGLIGFLGWVVPTIAAVTTTTYDYNTDGALTRVTKQVDGNAPVETYLVWDNFVPEADDPTTGTLSVANGNLRGYGPAPDTLETLFEFDRRDRLTAYVSGSESVSYSYDAMSLMATAETPEERIHFYYDNSANAQVVNMRAETSGLASRKLGPFYDLSDGTEQLLIRPDKDVAGVYDPAADGFSAYEYDAYGDQTDGGGQALDLRRNPFQYAGEYRDSVSGLTYLRARWYDPDFPTFLSRDPVANLSRYGYGDGDPRNRVDPSGRNSVHWGSFWKGWNRGGAKVMRALEGGAGARGTIERLLFGFPLGLVGMAAEPKGMVQMATKDHGWGTALLVGGIVAEIALDRYAPFNGYIKNYVSRIFLDFGVGVGESAFMAHEHGHFDKKSFFEGVELTIGNTQFFRVVAARGYRPFNLSIDEAMEVASLRETVQGETHVFRARRRVEGHISWGAGPIGDRFNLSLHHESLVLLSREVNGDYSIVVSESGVGGRGLRVFGWEESPAELRESLEEWGNGGLGYVGKLEGHPNEIRANPLRLHLEAVDTQIYPDGNVALPAGGNGPLRQWDELRLNCQDHVSALIKHLGL